MSCFPVSVISSINTRECSNAFMIFIIFISSFETNNKQMFHAFLVNIRSYSPEGEKL